MTRCKISCLTVQSSPLTSINMLLLCIFPQQKEAFKSNIRSQVSTIMRQVDDAFLFGSLPQQLSTALTR